ncbi:MAG TPA: biosynthetic peptidoglycan transglycosylase, partial [Oscillospiraceae bacterium]|nr:biosynthetic peptidoglycan transglycosylase [Oscillospiraceae bacterium]
MSTEKNSAAPKGKKTKKKSHPVKKALAVIGTTILSVVLIVIITGSIVATALTVYVMKFMDNTSDIDLYNLDLKSTSFIYAYDKEGKEVEIQRISRDENRIPVDISKVPDYVKMAFVCIEDERFFEHKGVDFKRTFAAFANMFLNFYKSQQGGSTITQQLVKNITRDDDRSIPRKIREIFTAMNLEKNYTKTDILEAYLN